MEETEIKLAILYADVSGSTRIYEQYGDAVARDNVEKCLRLLSEAASGMDGRVVKTIGDEIMCTFPNPVKAAMAAATMQQSLQETGEQGRFSIDSLHVKIGWHYGTVGYRGKEITGEAPATTQQIIKLAKADEILTSGQGLASLPEEMKRNARLIDTLEAEAYQGDLNVYLIPWQEEEEMTKMGSVTPAYDESLKQKSLCLEYHGRELRLDADHTHCSIGREEVNDLCVSGRFTSRQHAEIVFRHGLFHLRDISTNGTAIVFADGRTARLHRDEELLTDHGTICFGGLPDVDPQASVQFHCERAG